MSEYHDIMRLIKLRLRKIIPIVFFTLFILSGNSIAFVEVGQYKTHELVFTAESSPDNPFDTYLLKLEITDPNGKTFTIDGFFDGDGNGGQNGKVWKARICPYTTGIWSWKTVPGDVSDSGLSGLNGQFECVESGDTGGVIPDGHHFRFQNGDYVFLQGNFLDFSNDLRTTHTFMSETTTDSQRDSIILRHRNFHNANKANIYFANKGDYKQQSVTPWMGTASSNDKTRMDLARWKLYDDYILRFKESKMLAEMWFFADDSNFGGLSESEKNRLFRYGLSRTSSFSHAMYVIALEWGEGWSSTNVIKAGNYIQAHNPWGRPVSVHNHEDWAFSGQSWANFIATQCGNNSDNSQVNQLAIDWRDDENIPHIDEEFGILRSDHDIRLRGNMWANFCGGAAGGGTGSDLKAFMRFLSQTRIPFQRMKAANHLVSGGGSIRFVLAEEGHHYVVYSISGSFNIEISGEGLIGHWFNPRDSVANLSASVAVPSGTNTFTPPNNSSSDWILWISDGTSLNSGNLHPSPGKIITNEVIPSSTNDMPQVAITSPTSDETFFVGDIVTIVASASDGDGWIEKVEFFDGSEKLGRDTTEPYIIDWNTSSATAGPHNLRVQATDNNGSTGISTTISINISTGSNPPIISEFSANPDSIVKGSTVTFTLRANDTDDTRLQYSLDADGDGTPEDVGSLASGAVISYVHNFAVMGIYNSTASVFDSLNQKISKSTTINVADFLRNAATGANPSSGQEPLNVLFSGSSKGGIPPFSYSWDFGDGILHPGPGNDVSHTYTVPGHYTAQVTVTDSLGNSEIGQTQILVDEDTTAPALVSASVYNGPTRLVLIFSEAVQETEATNIANYKINNGVEVEGASLGSDQKMVTLITSPHVEELAYTLTLNNISDKATNPNTIAPNTAKYYSYVSQLTINNLSIANGGAYLIVPDSLDVGAIAYIDRDFIYSYVPVGFVGATYIRTANGDKAFSGDSFLSFDVNQEVAVYVAYDDRISTKPSWMDSFIDTGDDLVTTDTTLSLFEKDYP